VNATTQYSVLSTFPMTLSSHPRSTIVSEPVADSETRATDARSAWRVWGMLVATIGCIYLLMYNPYWVPGGDSELYIAVGRSWATGLRHTFNGQFVSMSPPGWPLVLAAAMKISPTFGFLKLITITCMTFAMGLWYWFLLRFSTPGRAAMLTLLTAIISHVYSLSFWMHSDALFCLIATAALVVACQINERKSHLAWRIALLAALCIAAQLVRWAGVLQWPVIGGLLVRGQPAALTLKRFKKYASRLKTAPWIAVYISFVVTTGTFLIVRQSLKLTHEQEKEAQEAGAVFDEQSQPQVPTESVTPALFAPKQSVKLTYTQEMIRRVRDSGKWFSWLLWPELRFAGGVKVMSSIDTVIGWLLIIPLVIAGWVGARRREWMWLGIGLYCVCLCLNWPNPNSRYFVPIAPILLWGMFEGIRLIFAWLKRATWGVELIKVVVASVAIANLGLLAVDICVARSSDFYGHYEGGLDESLISCVKYLNTRGVGDGEIAVSEVYTNLGKRRQSKFGLRATAMLSNRIVKNMPGKWDAGDVNKVRFINWTRSRHIKWYLYQQPISPWRVWHFRLPAGLQKFLSGEEVAPESAGWVLYRYVAPVNATIPLPMPHVVTIAPAKWVKVDVPIVHNWPTRVPGME
jgi:hypothetical protein